MKLTNDTFENIKNNCRALEAMMKNTGGHMGFLILFVKGKDSGSSGWIVQVSVWLCGWYCRQGFSSYNNKIISEE